MTRPRRSSATNNKRDAEAVNEAISQKPPRKRTKAVPIEKPGQLTIIVLNPGGRYEGKVYTDIPKKSVPHM